MNLSSILCIAISFFYLVNPLITMQSLSFCINEKIVLFIVCVVRPIDGLYCFQKAKLIIFHMTVTRVDINSHRGRRLYDTIFNEIMFFNKDTAELQGKMEFSRFNEILVFDKHVIIKHNWGTPWKHDKVPLQLILW